MSTRIGIYPGGPHAAVPGKNIHGRRYPMRVEEIEEYIAVRSVRRGRRSRWKRLIFALAMTIPVAVGLGLAVARSIQVPADGVERAERSPDSAISREVDRVLLELWKMDEADFARTQGRY